PCFDADFLVADSKFMKRRFQDVDVQSFGDFNESSI
ncbi:hypothetical protein Tco_1289470, partial [Tanacetum coccineum]